MKHTSPSQLNTHQCIKLLALVLMTVDHVGAYLHPDLYWYRAIGRITVPIWFFLIGHVTQYTIKYDTVLWAVVLALLHPVLGGALLPLNALVTILFCQQLLGMIERHGLLQKEPLLLGVACVLFSLPTGGMMEYGTQGVLYALMGYAVRSGQMTWRSGKLISVTALVLYLAFQLAPEYYTLAQRVCIVLGTSAVTLYLARFTWRPLRLRVPVVMARPLVWLSRHSLQYYVVHRTLLEAMGLVWGVSRFGWRLIEW